MAPSEEAGGELEEAYVGKLPGMAGLGAALMACRARAFMFPPSLEILRSLPRDLGLASPSSAEKVDISSVDWVAAAIE